MNFFVFFFAVSLIPLVHSITLGIGMSGGQRGICNNPSSRTGSGQFVLTTI